MRTGTRHEWLLVAVALPLLCAGLPAAAQDEAEAADAGGETSADGGIDREALRADRMVKAYKYQVNSRISRYLAAAAEESDEGNVKKAKELLGKLNPNRLNPLERAMVYRLKAYIDYTAGDYKGAIASFEQVLAEEVMPIDAEDKIRFNIAQINASLQNWSGTIKALERWFEYAAEPLPLAYYLLGISYYQLDKIDLAIENTEKAVDLSAEPAEGWLQLLAALYVQKEDYASAAPIFEELLLRFPKKQYWVQLALIYGARDRFKESLSVQQVAYLQGFLVEDSELMRLARSYLYSDLPLPAARVIAKGLEEGNIEPSSESYELLANSLIAAREYDDSLEPLHKAAELSDDGNLYVRLGQVYLQREEWDRAAAELQHALGKGGLKDPGNAQLLLGIALYNDNQVGSARSSFVRASEHEKTRAAARRWIEHIANESKTS